MPSIAKDSSQSVTRITDHLARVKRRVRKAAEEAGRNPKSVSILAVSKQQPATLVEMAAAAGQRAFGESYLQEAIAKMDALAERDLEWHFIGRVQSNKTRLIAERFDWLHTVDRKKIAERLNAQRPTSLPALNVCIQVKLAAEASKGGAAPADLIALAEVVARQPRLKLRGLMCIPPVGDTPQDVRPYFRRLRELLGQLKEAGFDVDTLSMGMSADLEAAVSEGSTLVRIGTAIFGPRRARD